MASEKFDSNIAVALIGPKVAKAKEPAPRVGMTDLLDSCSPRVSTVVL